jgi:hypothetical protein
MSKSFVTLHKHKKRAAITLTLLTSYFSLCKSATKWEKEVLRFGIAGSLANVAGECSFHFVDTINIKTKAH